jgi:ligand-binding SRPBCC domain-containing protein
MGERTVPSFEVSSVVAAPREAVWARVSTMEGVNAEMLPLVRMTHPAGVESLRPQDVVLGERLFRSWILLFGVLPFDYDDLVLVRIDEGRGFHERSTMLSQRLWEHERLLEDAGPGRTRVTDRVRFEPRLPLLGRVQRSLFTWFFRRRHRLLAAHFAA